MNDKIMIIDGNSILNRAFYGLQGGRLLANTEGIYTNAILGFLNIIFKYKEEEKPNYLCVAFDMKAPTFRHIDYAAYKANRKGMPEELAVQLPFMKDVLDAMNITRLEREGYEADDILGTLSLCAEQQGMEVVVITGDRDSLQLASTTTKIKIPTTRAGKPETDDFDYNKVVEKYGVTPTQFIDVKGLMGDASDNIPGVPGIGEKTALDLIKSFGSIENIYENITKVEKKGVREKLESNKDLAFQCKKLATIDRQVPELCNVRDMKIKEYKAPELYNILKRLELKSYIAKFGLEEQQKSTSKDAISNVSLSFINKQEELSALKDKITEKKEFALYYILEKIDAFNSALLGLGVAFEKNNATYVDLTNELNENIFLSEFKEIFESNSIKKYGHDLKAFIYYLKNKRIELNQIGFDTLIGGYIINSSRESFSISQLASEYRDKQVEEIEKYYIKSKGIYTKDLELREKIGQVAGTHAEAVLDIIEPMNELLINNGQEELYYDIELPLVEVLADMEHHGFKVNIEDLREFSRELEKKIIVLEKDIFSLCGEEFNLSSPKQLGVVLFEKLQLPVIKKTKTGYSTDAEVLEQLSTQHEAVVKIIEFRQLMKLKSTYTEGLINVINPTTGKIHSSFNQTVTSTGRISSTEPNLQNIPIRLEMGRKIRKVFVPTDETFVLADADYSQIELRVLADIANDTNMINAFINNEDIHTSTAAQIFGITNQEVTPAMRSGAKAVNFGIVYGIGDFSLSKDLGITKKEARKYIDGYLEKYPGVKAYMQDIVAFGKEHGYVETMFKRRRTLPELKSSNFNIRSFGERIAMNTPIQGSAADIIKIAMVKVYKTLKEKNLKSRLILQVHDELIIETKKDEQEEVAEILKDCMESAVNMKVPITVEVKIGSNWYETK